ncbi:MAG: response regulator transcription factor [Planctomycetota bacterium]
MSSKIKVLHVEDDQSLLNIVRKLLEKINCEIVSYDNYAGDEGIVWSDFNLLILDFMLPATTGLDIGEAARVAGYKGPILILSSKALTPEEHNKLTDLEGLFMTKPFGPQGFINRVQEILSEFSNEEK